MSSIQLAFPARSPMPWCSKALRPLARPRFDSPVRVNFIGSLGASGASTMFVGQNISVKGFVTQQKYLSGRSLQQIELLLGYHAGRLSRGASFATLDRLPAIDEFETFGYSQVAAHRHVVPADLDPIGLRRMAMSAWSLVGPDRLIKAFATTPHDEFDEPGHPISSRAGSSAVEDRSRAFPGRSPRFSLGTATS